MARSALTDQATPLNVQPVAAMPHMGDPVFSDEFAGSSLNGAKWQPWYPDVPFWNTTTPGGHKTNSNEPQGYDETGITFVDDADGKRVMRFTMHESNHAVPELAYTSGMVCSYPSFVSKYGYFEARLKVPNAWGSWPAFWRMPADFVWPPEEDIFENWGRDTFNGQSSSAVHFPNQVPSRTAHHQFAGDTGGVWRTFGELREPGRMRTYFDGTLVADWEIDPAYERDMYLLCNLAGDKDNHAGVANSAPFSMDVDYIRAWSLDGSDSEEPTPVEDSLIRNNAGETLTPHILRNGAPVAVTPKRRE